MGTGEGDTDVTDADAVDTGAADVEGAGVSSNDTDTVSAAPQMMKAAPTAGDAGEAAALKGRGTAEEPYQVATVDDLKLVAEKVNAGEAGYASALYKLTANIDLAPVKNWEPIGSSEHKFTGTFVGTGYTISNLTVDMPDLEGAGLFGWLDRGKLQDVTIVNANVIGQSRVAALVGAGYTGSIEGCAVKGAITIKGHQFIGGVSGHGYASIKNCKVEGVGESSITGEYKNFKLDGDNVGGIIGYRAEGNLLIEDCSVSGLAIAGVREVGGIAGGAYTGNTITGCVVKDIRLICNAPYSYRYKQALAIGGLVGGYVKDSEGTLSNCTIDGVSFDVTDPQMKAENHPILGLVTGGVRISSTVMGGDGHAVNVSGLTIKGDNTGMNGEQKMPGSSIVNATAELPFDGAGTAEDPYIISSVDDLKLLQKTVNSTGLTYEGQHLKLADGVEFDLSGEKWTSIGTSGHKFMGTFDGNGATIKGLTDVGTYGTYGLFGYISGATIKNMKFVDVKLEYNDSNRGAVAGCLYGTNTIEGIEVSGSIAGRDYVGGIAGRPYLDKSNPGTLTIRNCVNNATISGKTKIGGIVGYARADVADSTLCVVEGCVNNGAVSDAQYAGGIAGWAYNAELKGCTNTARVSGSTSAGGIVGNTNQNVKIDSCKNSGEVVVVGEAAKESGAGGIIGVANSGNAKVTKCANTGSVMGVTSAGGIIGGTGVAGDTIENCYNGGAITATGDGAVAAGIHAYNNSASPVKACFNDGDVRAEKGTVYQIGLSNFWYEPAPGSKIASCYFTGADGKIYAAAEDGKGESIEQKDMTRDDLAQTLNAAGGVPNFWQAQNGSVQPDQLIPGAWDDEGKAAAEVLDTKGDIVERYESFEAAVAAVEEGQTIKLVKDVTVTGKLDITVAMSIDLNGCTLKGTDPTYSFGLKGVGRSRVFDSSADKSGKISAASRALVIDGVGVEVVLDNVTVEADKYVAQVSSSAQVTLEGGTYTGADAAFAMYGTKDQANKDKPTTINVEQGASVTGGKSYAISSQGSASYLGPVNIHINGGEIISRGATGGAVYMPAHGEFVMTDGRLEGAQGVQICDAVTVRISGGKIEATNPNTIVDPSKQGDGIVEDGAALSIVSRGGGYGAAGTATVEVTGGTFVAAANPAIREYGFGNITGSLVKDMSLSGSVTVTNLKAGAPALEISLLKGEAAKVVSGGTYSSPLDEANLADGFGLLEKDESGNYVVHEHVWADKLESDKDGHWHACTKCGERTETAPHEKTKTVGAKEATCGKDGYTGDTVCADCGYVIRSGSVIPATGKHAAGDTWKTDDVSHWRECADCGAKLDEAAHDFGAWRVTKEATATEEGSRERTCKTCGKIVYEAIPALGGEQGETAPQDKPGSQETPNAQEKPGKGDKLAQTGDTSMLGMAAVGIAGISSALAGIFAARRRRDDE